MKNHHLTHLIHIKHCETLEYCAWDMIKTCYNYTDLTAWTTDCYIMTNIQCLILCMYTSITKYWLAWVISWHKPRRMVPVNANETGHALGRWLGLVLPLKCKCFTGAKWYEIVVIIGSESGSIYCDILGSYGCNCNEYCLLERDTPWSGKNLAIFWSM